MNKDELIKLLDVMTMDKIVEFKIEYTDFSADNRIKTITFEE